MECGGAAGHTLAGPLTPAGRTWPWPGAAGCDGERKYLSHNGKEKEKYIEGHMDNNTKASNTINFAAFLV